MGRENKKPNTRTIDEKSLPLIDLGLETITSRGIITTNSQIVISFDQAPHYISGQLCMVRVGDGTTYNATIVKRNGTGYYVKLRDPRW